MDARIISLNCVLGFVWSEVFCSIFWRRWFGLKFFQKIFQSSAGFNFSLAPRFALHPCAFDPMLFFVGTEAYCSFCVLLTDAFFWCAVWDPCWLCSGAPLEFDSVKQIWISVSPETFKAQRIYTWISSWDRSLCVTLVPNTNITSSLAPKMHSQPW